MGHHFQSPMPGLVSVTSLANIEVAVTLQETLTGLSTQDSSGYPVTVDDAVSISNNALEHTVRCILAAIQAPEVLDSSRGLLLPTLACPYSATAL